MPKYSRGFGTLEDLQNEIDVLENQEQENMNIDNANKKLNAADETWKDRYGNLRSHSAKKENELNERIRALETQIDSLSKKDIQYPKSEAEVEAWLRKYPDLGKIIETLALRRLKSVNEEVEKVRTEASQTRLETQKERARIQLEKLHPDFFDDIDPSPEFHVWLKKKPKYLQDAIYENDTDAEAAAEVIAFYKAENGKTKVPNRQKETYRDKDSARDVSSKGSKTANFGDLSKHTFKESEVRAMHADEYAQYETEIDKAIAEGRMIYDVRD